MGSTGKLNYPLIIGHRGASAHAPENTLAAFQLALDAGADGVEFDVQLSRDGQPVVIHDADLKRTGLTPRRVRDLTLSELKKTDVGSWFDRSFAGERIPTLEEVFDLLEPTPALLYLEIKTDPSQRDQMVRTCCDYIRRSSVKDRVIVECFDLEAIRTVKSINTDIKTAALFDSRLPLPSPLRLGRQLVERALEVEADEIAVHHRLATKTLTKIAKDADMKVVVWTVDNKSWISRAHAYGIAALICNDPGAMVHQRDSSL